MFCAVSCVGFFEQASLVISAVYDTPIPASSDLRGLVGKVRARRRCSVPTYLAPRSPASVRAALSDLAAAVSKVEI